MTILIECEHCRQKLSALETMLGKRIRCPKCGGISRVPPPAAESPEPAPPPAAEEEGREPLREKAGTRAPSPEPARDEREPEEAPAQRRGDRAGGRGPRPAGQVVLRTFVLL